MTPYDVLKDFAGPAATLVASLAVFSASVVFGRAQRKTAEAQVAIAQDKLKFDLFNHRYKIYAATKTLLEYVIHVRNLDVVDPEKVRDLYITIDESRFFFAPDIQAYLRDITSKVEKFLTLVGLREPRGTVDDRQWAAAADEIGAASHQLHLIYRDLPQKFEKALSFERVTTT